MFMDSPPLLCSSLRDRQEGTRADGYSRGEKRKLSHYWRPIELAATLDTVPPGHGSDGGPSVMRQV